MVGEESARLFGPEECPVFEPTEKASRDPMGYVRKIEKEGRRYGTAKILPPKGWKIPFVTDTEVRFRYFLPFFQTFRFVVYLHYLTTPFNNPHALTSEYFFHAELPFHDPPFNVPTPLKPPPAPRSFFLEQLYRFHRQQDNTRVPVPRINNKPIDLGVEEGWAMIRR